MTTYVLTVDVHDLEPTGPVPATAEVRLWRALPDGSAAQVVSTRQQTLKVGTGPTTVTLTAGVAYWAEFTGVRGWETPFLFSGTTDTSIAERWRNGQLDPTGLQPLPAVPLLATAVAAVQAQLTAILQGAPGAYDTFLEVANEFGLDEATVTALQALVAGKAPLASPALTGTPTAPTVAGSTDSSTALATTAFVQAVATALGTSVSATYVSKAQAELNVLDFGAKGDGTTDDTTAIQAFFDTVTAAGCQGFMPARNYLVTDEIKVGTGTGGSLNWHIVATGATITQATDNKAILRFWKELTRYFTIEGLQFQWANQQPVANTRASAILFDSDTNNNFGFYNFRLVGLSWGNGVRGISINESNTNTNPIWGFKAEKISHLSTMTGSAVKLLQAASGQPNASFEQWYLRGDSFAETSDAIINVSGYHGLTMTGIEFNNSVGRELQLATCEAVDIRNLRSERGTLSINFAGLWTFSDVRGRIAAIEVQSHTFSAANWAYVIRAIGSGTVLSVDTATVMSLTIPTGQVALINADTAGSVEFTGGFRNSSSITKFYAFDNTISRVTRDANTFPGMGLVTKELNGAGKTTVTDADFVSTPPNDTIVIVRNTTDNTIKLAMRANGTWRYAAIDTGGGGGGGGPTSNFTATTDPVVSSDTTGGYAPGSQWINTSTAVVYECLSAATGAAVWRRLTADVQVFTTSGTWTKPAWATTVQAALIGSGGGGGAGRRGVSGSASSGGAGGGGGAFTTATFPAAALSSTETVTVATGGAGAAVGTTDSLNGTAGSSGTTTSFGTHIRAGGGAGGGGGTGAGSTGGAPGTGGANASTGGAGNAGSAGSSSTTATGGAAGGGGGGGVTTAPAFTAGGSGGSAASVSLSGGGAGGGTAGANGTSATAATTGAAVPGAGGGGGASNTTAAAGNGGNAASYGGGGGGGGASLNGFNSGAGGNGGDGIAVIIST